MQRRKVSKTRHQIITNHPWFDMSASWQDLTFASQRGSFALLCLLGSASLALAQHPDDSLRTFPTKAQSATVHAAQAQLERRDSQPTGGQSSAYSVSGVILGATVKFGSHREYNCGPSDQFDGFTWCQKTRQEKERRGKFISTYSILHSRAGAAVYIDRYLEPAFFGAREVDDDIRQYSRNIGETPRITRMPQRDGFPNGILALWGKVELEPLDNDSIKALAEGRRPTTKGYFIDFIGDFARSAKESLPIYRISGGAGFVWVASFDQKGRGTLRLTAVDASVLAPATTPSASIETVERAKEQDAIANIINQLSREEAETQSADNARIDAERARENADKEQGEAARAKADIDKAAVIERAKLNALLEPLEAEKGATEAKARAMETAAHGAIIVLIVLVVTVACAFALRKRRIAGVRRQPVKSETREFEPDEVAEVTETKSSLNPASQRSTASRSRQGAQLFPRPSGPAVIVGIMIAGTLCAGVIGALLYTKTRNPYEHRDASRIAKSMKAAWEFRIKKRGMSDRAKAFVIGWQENEHGAGAEVVGECMNQSINFKATVLGSDAETVELPWADKLEDYRNEIGKFMQVIYLPIAVKINNDEPQVIKRLHEEPYRNVIRLVTLSEPLSASKHQQPPSGKNISNNTTITQLDELLSVAEKATLTFYYPDRKLRASEVRRIMFEFDTSKGIMLIKIMMDDPAIQKLVHFCQNN
jgi:hypothetical protein